MLRKALLLRWQEVDGTEREEKIHPLDLLSDGEGEFLYAADLRGHLLRIRLDLILDSGPGESRAPL